MSKKILYIYSSLDESLAISNIIRNLGIFNGSLHVAYEDNSFSNLEQVIQDDRFHVVIADLNDKYVHCVALLEKIRELPALSDSKVMIFASEENQLFAQECKSNGAEWFVVKPGNAADLGEVLKAHYGYLHTSLSDY